MGLLDQMWDDVVAGPQPEHGLEQFKRLFTKPSLNLKDIGGGDSSMYHGSTSMPTTPTTPGSPSASLSPTAAKRDNVWRSVFNPGKNMGARNIGTDYFDKPMPNSPTVYDWLYSMESRSKHR